MEYSTPKEENCTEKTSYDSNGKRNSESVSILNTLSENPKGTSSFVNPVIEEMETSEKTKPADLESTFAAKEEIVLKFLKPGSVEYTVRNKTHFVSTVHITLKNNENI